MHGHRMRKKMSVDRNYARLKRRMIGWINGMDGWMDGEREQVYATTIRDIKQ